MNYGIAVSIALFTLGFNRAALADEGMWTFNNLPLGTLQSKYGFAPTKDWADHLMKSSVRLNIGGSGSFISSTGLVLTNHHVAADALQQVSTPEHDYYRTGFYAKSTNEEIKIPNLEIDELLEIHDVSADVNAAVKPGMDPGQARLARLAAIAKIEKSASAERGLKAQVVTLYQGGLFQLYLYKKYTDVRVVFAPEFDIAFFGGDPDNFEYPRFDLDMAILRVYEEGKPAQTPDFLKWNPRGAADGSLVFVSGNPGNTQRIFTVAELETQRDLTVPFRLDILLKKEAATAKFMAESPELAREAKESYFNIQNSRKVYQGQMDGFARPDLLDGKRRAESELRARVGSDPGLSKLYGTAWDEIGQAQAASRSLFKDKNLLEGWYGIENSTLFRYARRLVRLVEESAKPDSERLPEYQGSMRDELLADLFSEEPLYPEFEKFQLELALTLVSEGYSDKAYMSSVLLAGKSPAERAAELMAKTRLLSVSERKRIAALDELSLRASDDGLIQLALALDDQARSLRQQYDNQVTAVETEGYTKIAGALFAVYGTTRYPDATFTPRLSFGLVQGYEQSGAEIPSTTTLGGAFEHEAEHGALPPYRLPDSWHKHKGELDLALPYDFVSTADIIGGNSGSPVVDRAGELVGLIFDGNIQSLTADFVYDDVRSRAVAVETPAIFEAMRKIYGASELADQLGR